MKKTLQAALILSAITLTGCMMPSEQTNLMVRIDRMERELAALKAETKTTNEKAGRVLADTGADFDTMRREFDVMRGKFDERDFRLKKLEESVDLMGSSIHSLDEDIKKAGSATVEDVKKSIEAIETRLDALEKTKISPEAKDITADPKTLYDEALELIRNKKDYKSGIAKLERLITKNPKHELAANAQYWIGEAYYGSGDYERAIVELQKVIKNHPKSGKIAASLLKQGMAFEKLKDKESAEAIYVKITEEHPKSDEAKTAKERLKEFKKTQKKQGSAEKAPSGKSADGKKEDKKTGK